MKAQLYKKKARYQSWSSEGQLHRHVVPKDATDLHLISSLWPEGTELEGGLVHTARRMWERVCRKNRKQGVMSPEGSLQGSYAPPERSGKRPPQRPETAPASCLGTAGLRPEVAMRLYHSSWHQRVPLGRLLRQCMRSALCSSS